MTKYEPQVPENYGRLMGDLQQKAQNLDEMRVKIVESMITCAKQLVECDELIKIVTESMEELRNGKK